MKNQILLTTENAEIVLKQTLTSLVDTQFYAACFLKKIQQ